MNTRTPRILPSEITSRELFLDRRRVLRYAAAGAAFGALGFAETGRSAHPGHDRPTTVTFRKTVA